MQTQNASSQPETSSTAPGRRALGSRVSAAPRVLAGTLFALSLLGTSAPLSAQSLAELTASPEEASELFLRSVRAIRWSAATQFVAAETLERFRLTVTMIADADTTGAARSHLVNTDSLGMQSLTSSEVFDRAIGVMIDDMPGLMHSLYDRDDDVLGHVPEGPDDAHVVYRTTARISGAVPEVKVMQMRHGSDGWRVRWSDELEVLEAALRGFRR